MGISSVPPATSHRSLTGIWNRRMPNFHDAVTDLVPIADSALLSSKIVKNAKLTVLEGAPHGMCTTLKDRVNEDLYGFIKA